MPQPVRRNVIEQGHGVGMVKVKTGCKTVERRLGEGRKVEPGEIGDTHAAEMLEQKFDQEVVLEIRGRWGRTPVPSIPNGTKQRFKPRHACGQSSPSHRIPCILILRCPVIPGDPIGCRPPHDLSPTRLLRVGPDDGKNCVTRLQRIEGVPLHGSRAVEEQRRVETCLYKAEAVLLQTQDLRYKRQEDGLRLRDRYVPARSLLPFPRWPGSPHRVFAKRPCQLTQPIEGIYCPPLSR